MEILSLKNAIRVIDFKILLNNENKYNINNIPVLNKFFSNYRHPDLPLSILLEADDDLVVSYDWFHDLTALLKQLDANLIFKSRLGNIDEKSLQLLSAFYSVVIKKHTLFKEMDDNLIYLTSRNTPLTVELLIDDHSVSLLKEFKDFYDVLKIRSTYSINYFSHFKDKHIFVENLLDQFDLVIKNSNSTSYIHELGRRSYWPDFAKSFTMNYDGIITDSKYSKLNLVKDSIIIGEEFNKLILKKDLKKCNCCIALQTCNGGFYSIFEDTPNSDVFCAVNMGMVLLRNKFLSGGYNEKNGN